MHRTPVSPAAATSLDLPLVAAARTETEDLGDMMRDAPSWAMEANSMGDFEMNPAPSSAALGCGGSMLWNSAFIGAGGPHPAFTTATIDLHEAGGAEIDDALQPAPPDAAFHGFPSAMGGGCYAGAAMIPMPGSSELSGPGQAYLPPPPLPPMHPHPHAMMQAQMFAVPPPGFYPGGAMPAPPPGAGPFPPFPQLPPAALAMLHQQHMAAAAYGAAYIPAGAMGMPPPGQFMPIAWMQMFMQQQAHAHAQQQAQQQQQQQQGMARGMAPPQHSQRAAHVAAPPTGPTANSPAVEVAAAPDLQLQQQQGRAPATAVPPPPSQHPCSFPPASGNASAAAAAAVLSLQQLPRAMPSMHTVLLAAGPLPAGAARAARLAGLERYRLKKARRMYGKQIRYHMRKVNAERRPRVKGRFVKAAAQDARTNEELNNDAGVEVSSVPEVC